MARWGTSKQVPSVKEEGDSTTQLPSSIIEGRDEKKVRKPESPVTCRISKRTCVTRSQEREAKAGGPAEQKGATLKNKQNKQQNCDRWSTERYKTAVENMLEIMKAEGAVFEKPISRSALRSAARKRIGDTGLLDHLLKHIDGSVAPGGTERFRRCYNTAGVMEYWLESADLVKLKREAGVADPNWLPPSWWKNGSVSGESGELKRLKEEIAKMKSDMRQLVSRQKMQDQSDVAENMQKEFLRWRAKTDRQLIEISKSLSSTQDMYKELISWKDKVEKQLMGISDSLNSLQASKGCTTFNPTPVKWEDWLESTSLDNFQGEGFETWFENPDFIDVLPEVVVQDPYSAPHSPSKPSNSVCRDLVCGGEELLLVDETAKTKRNIQELLPRNTDEDQANMTPDSSITANLKPDIENSMILSQETFKEMLAWKANVEQQLKEISNAVAALQARKWT